MDPVKVREPGRSAQRFEIVLFMVCLTLAVVLAAAAVLHALSPGFRHPFSQPAIANLQPSAVIGRTRSGRLSTHTPFVLVEFADYECGPCRTAHAQLREKYLKLRPDRVELVFRNYPLTYHRLALKSAIVAEWARIHGRFSLAHDALFDPANELSQSRIDAIRFAVGIPVTKKDWAAAQQVVGEDAKDAIACGVTGTPTFFLCCPDSKVIRLGSLSQLERFVK
jgi:protein-disulfide isomerase